MPQAKGGTLHSFRRFFQKSARAIFSPTAPHRGAYAGRTALASGSSSVTVSTAVVNSDSIILMGTQVGSAAAAHNSGSNIVVNSIVSGASFAFARATGTAVPWDETVMWEICRRS